MSTNWRRYYDFESLLRFWCGVGKATNLFSSAHRFERARDDLRRARTVHVVSRFGFEQFRVRENNPELIVEAMEEETQFRRFVHWSPRQELLNRNRLLHQA